MSQTLTMNTWLPLTVMSCTFFTGAFALVSYFFALGFGFSGGRLLSTLGAFFSSSKRIIDALTPYAIFPQLINLVEHLTGVGSRISSWSGCK